MYCGKLEQNEVICEFANCRADLVTKKKYQQKSLMRKSSFRSKSSCFFDDKREK